MDSVLSFPDRRNTPDAEFVSSDEQGRPLFTFMVEYDGGRFSIWAYDHEDAEAQITAMAAGGLRLAGQIVREVTGV